METGESRTLWPVDQSISNGIPRSLYEYISGVLKLNIRQVYGIFDLEADSPTLLLLLLNQLIALGQTAQQFKQDLDNNVYFPDYIAEKPRLNLEK